MRDPGGGCLNCQPVLTSGGEETCEQTLLSKQAGTDQSNQKKMFIDSSKVLSRESQVSSDGCNKTSDCIHLC